MAIPQAHEHDRTDQVLEAQRLDPGQVDLDRQMEQVLVLQQGMGLERVLEPGTGMGMGSVGNKDRTRSVVSTQLRMLTL